MHAADARVDPGLAGVSDVTMHAVYEEQLERLLQTHGSALRRLCAVYERNAADRDDLMQEIGFAIWRALPTFRGECSERTFIYRIAHNRVLSHRFRKRIPATPLTDTDDIEDTGARTDAAAEQASEHERLWDAVRQLPESLREPVVLRLEGMNDREISDVLGISEGNVAVRLTRARQALRVALGSASTRTAP